MLIDIYTGYFEELFSNVLLRGKKGLVNYTGFQGNSSGRILVVSFHILHLVLVVVVRGGIV